MLIKIFDFIGEKLIGRLPEDRRAKAKEHFYELMEMFVQNAFEGTARGLKK